MTPAARERIAAAAWERTGGRPAPPRDLEPVLPLAFEVCVTRLSPLTHAAIGTWFRDRIRPCPPIPDRDRPLLGCAVAHRGFGHLFLDSQLSADDSRTILAHEFGHYLLEHLLPRERIVRRLGTSVLPVLDGDRPATDVEIAAGVLAGVTFGCHLHFLDRSFDPTSNHDAREMAASDLGLELLAPAAEVLASGRETAADLERILVQSFGLSVRWAGGYATRLAARTKPPSRRWGL